MPAKTSCAFAVSITCDNAQENQKAFKAAFESAVRALQGLSGAEPHDAGNGQFYGTGFVGAEEVYFHERDVEAEAAKPAQGSVLKKSG